MKKCYARAAVAAFLAVSLLIIIMAAATVKTYANTYYVKDDLPEGEERYIYWGTTFDPDAVTYISITPSKKGIIEFSTDFFCYVTLCDKDRNVLSRGKDETGDFIDINNTNSFMQKVYYAVEKGKQYKLKIVNMANFTTNGGYYGKIKYTNTKISPAKYGKSKKKAKAIKRKKKINGLFIAGNKKAQWYKVTTKQKKTKIYIAAPKQNYAFKFRIYYKDGRKWRKEPTILTRQTDYSTNTFVGKVNKKAKHTYYIKVWPEGKSSGTYTIKWK